ncbi:MAG TPA: hypothetical protein VFH44_02340 [Solirubrobacterales bacterium]|nr:hypothetical protein [Solirubrobacterales bacterium]
MELTSQEIEDERRRGRLAGIAALLGVVIFIAAMGLAGEFNGAEQAEQLQTFDSVKGDLLLQVILQAVAVLLFVPALVSLFRSIRARSDAIRPGLIGIVIASPILLAASLIVTYFAFKTAADAFLDPAAGYDTASDDVADDVFYEQFPAQLRTGLGLAGSLGLAFTTVYLSLQAMRAGLLTRFWGTLAMALGVGTLLFGSLMLLAFMIVVALLIAAWWPGTRPPAWEAGKAIPWPSPGRPSDAEPSEPDLAEPADFDGTATEVEPAPGESKPDEVDQPRKRKRKQRD